MFSGKVFGRLLPSVCNIQQLRKVRPTVKIGKEKFEITLSVHQFNKDELRVKARPEYVVIEGKMERDTKKGYILRQFSKKFKLPKGCDPDKIRTTLNADGTMTITAPRAYCEINMPCEKNIPISMTDKKTDESIVHIKNEKVSTADYCKKLIEDCTKKIEKK